MTSEEYKTIKDGDCIEIVDSAKNPIMPRYEYLIGTFQKVKVYDNQVHIFNTLYVSKNHIGKLRKREQNLYCLL